MVRRPPLPRRRHPRQSRLTFPLRATCSANRLERNHASTRPLVVRLVVGGWCQKDGMSSDAERLWDGYANDFDDEADHGLRHPQVRAGWQALLVPLLPQRPARIVDLSCGTGSLAVLLAELGNGVSGVDTIQRQGFGDRLRAPARCRGGPRARTSRQARERRPHARHASVAHQKHWLEASNGEGHRDRS